MATPPRETAPARPDLLLEHELNCMDYFAARLDVPSPVCPSSSPAIADGMQRSLLPPSPGSSAKGLHRTSVTCEGQRGAQPVLPVIFE